MKVGVRPYFSVGRPPVKFHRVRSPFDSPTVNYSDNIVGQNVGRFRSPKTVAEPPSLLFSQLETVYTAHNLPSGPTKPSLLSASNRLARASESCPGPDPDCRHRCVRIIPKHVQNVSVFLIGLPSLFIRYRPILIGGSKRNPFVPIYRSTPTQIRSNPKI